MYGTLTKEDGKPGAMRTPSMRGEFHLLPKVGWGFVIANDEPLDKSAPGADGRAIFTSPVKRILEQTDKLVLFETHSGSIYRLALE